MIILSDKHRSELETGSAISPELIAERGYRTITDPADLPNAFADYQRRAGLLIPIRDVTGEVVTWQLKADDPRSSKQSKQIKYDTAAGGRQCLDVPTRSRQHLGDPAVPLWLTEGAKKCDAGLSHGIRCIVGLQGVYGFRGTNEHGGKVAISDFESIALNGREVVLAFDSDVMTKQPVRDALDRLSAFLAQRGAKVRYLLLPDLPDGEKCGLDDFLARYDAKQLAGYLVDALPDASRDRELPVLRLQTRLASAIEPREIEWVWKPWLPAGMIGLFAGYGGSGKSTVALDLAAACSVGGTLPDGQPAPLLNTLVFAAEDSPEYTIIPRLQAMGADLNRIHIVDGIARDGDDPGWIQLRNHIQLIEIAVREHDIGLVIIDPISSYIGDANSDKESDVRAGIMPIVAMAERTGAAVLLVRHVSKAGDGTRAASRILGSTAWHDVPRVAWMLADAPDDHQPEPNDDGTRDTRRVLGVVKSNLAATPQARWCIQPADGPMRWLPDPSPVAVDECFFSQSDRGTKGRDAEEWLRERLAGGSQPSAKVETAAKDAGISKASLKRARASLNVKARKEPSGEWVLTLPPRLAVVKSEGAQDEIEGVHSEGEHSEMNALHNNQPSKAFTVSPLIPFPESQGKPPLHRNTGSASKPGEESKAFKSPLKGPDERLYTSEREVMNDPPREWSQPVGFNGPEEEV